jgi:DNA-binding NarL/FixJ family response regulator
MGRPDWPGGLVAPIIWKRAARFRSSFHPQSKCSPILLALVWKESLLLPALLIRVALVDVLTQTQSRSQRIRRLHRGGLSQRSIASRLGVSRYAVRLALA